jgi:hypothetical protein
MVTVSQATTKAPITREATAPIHVSRIQFTDGAPSGADRRQFTHPRRAQAREEEASLESAASAGDGSEPVDECIVVCIPAGSSSQSRERAKALLGDMSRAVTLEHGPDALDWRPGLAVVQCREDSRKDIVSALIDFAFYEGNLRVLERSVEAAETQAQADVLLAHRVRYRDRAHWERFTDCAEQCSRMRLTYARLEPQLLAASRTLTAGARSWVTRLLQKSDMESRLESLNDRLEALEELYEAATQRIAEHRWYVGGHALEIGIIVLLVIECAMMGADIYMHNRARLSPRGAPAAAEVSAE